MYYSKKVTHHFYCSNDLRTYVVGVVRIKNKLMKMPVYKLLRIINTKILKVQLKIALNYICFRKKIVP